MIPPSAFMRKALEHAEGNKGQTWPNPCVGCVIVQGETIVGVGVTQRGGRPHAEDMALAQAGETAKGATVYVTLEPCAHNCTPKLIQAGVGCVVAALEDPDSRTAGQGLEALRRAGIRVKLGEGEAEAREAHRGFFSRLQRQRPVVDVKMGMSLDGRVALADGRSQWITGDVSRHHVQTLRSRYDALLTSCKTIAVDRARLTCRIAGREGHQPLRIVVGNAGRLTRDLPFFQEGGPIWLISSHNVPSSLEKFFDKIMHINSEEDIKKSFLNLGEAGINQVMVESGPALVTSLFRENLVDRWHLFYAPVFLGG
ncbi:MAG: bifunctional diaminohydroxyphosphoribosylaminopyrimidine deaminase/5-amino-6-(5-phosphoribosylamino)uracil reductase RibD, partial [Alphaproteobacteria bacterium]